MRILVVNAGSSSIKFSMYESGSDAPVCLYDGEVSGVGEGDAKLDVRGVDAGATRSVKTVEDAIAWVFDVASGAGGPDALGYRVVHPGPKLKGHQRITEDVLRELEAAVAFAPLHDPEALQVIHAGMKRFSAAAHVACFDTVFHETMPEEATTYPLPKQYREQGVRRYGFHGLSCESVVRQFGEAVPRRMAIAHLGSGCSVTAVVDGKSIDTTMGLTPTGGVVMGTRPGDLDPGTVLHLLRQQKDDATAALETMLNHNSGMVALTGMKNDMKAVREAGSAETSLALKVFTRSVTKAIGGYCWLMGGLDAIVFTGGIGEHDAVTRSEVLAGLREMGVSVESSLNIAGGDGMRRISASDSRTTIFVCPAQEDLMIAVHADRLVRTGK